VTLYLSKQHGAILPARDYLLCPARKISAKAKSTNKFFIEQAYLVKMADYWPHFLWTSATSRPSNTQKKNLAHIQPS